MGVPAGSLGQLQGPAKIALVQQALWGSVLQQWFAGRPASPPSPIRTVTVGPGIAPGRAPEGFAGCTAGRELHPAPKEGFLAYTPSQGKTVWHTVKSQLQHARLRGMKSSQTVLSAQNLRLAFVVSRFNQRVTRALLEGALEAYARLGGDAQAAWVLWVPGSFELPLAAQKLAQRPEVDGVVALGAVIRGETPHFEYVSAQAASGLMQVMLACEKPVAFGVLTTDSLEQAEDRAGGKAGNKGAEAVYSAVEMVQLLKHLASEEGQRP